MEKKHSEISCKHLDNNIFNLLDNQWALITAGNISNYNTMTASWGGFGILWNKPVATIYVRPQRHTFNYTEANDFFTLCFFNEEFKPLLKKLGTVSGRDMNKMNIPELNVFATNNNSVAFEEALLYMECKILYSDYLKQEFFKEKENISKFYPINDFHKFYIAEIIACYKKK